MAAAALLLALVTLDQGILRGSILRDYKDGVFYGFKGVPYAQPPVGELRFKDPVAPGKWNGTLDATKHGNVCYQRFFLQDKVRGSEDCLFLNVFTRKLPSGDGQDARPVMVWIHGGGFEQGDGSSEWYGPEFLMTEDVVLVTMNYRLGIFGFLNYEESESKTRGNAGLKDIVMALRWVKKNIGKFSGDPDNVTIFGESAGAAAVHYLVLSPMAKGLFHKAILQSGVVFNPWAHSDAVPKEAFQACSVEGQDWPALVEALRASPAEELLKCYAKLSKNFEVSSKRHFGPIVESSDIENAFISEQPLDIIKSGKYNHVPMIFGYTSLEGMLIEFFRNDSNNLVLSDLDTHIPHILNYPKGSQESRAVAEKIKAFYLNNKDLIEANVEDTYTLASDNYFVVGIMGSIKQHLKTSENKIYLYKMTVESKLNFVKNIFNFTSSGVSHGDDIGYLFKTYLTPKNIEKDSLEDISIKRFVKLWTNFARFGNPTKDITDEMQVDWKPVQDDLTTYLEIGKELSIKSNPESERMAFWRNIFEANDAWKGFL